MKKEDYLSLIKAAEGLQELERICIMLTHTALSGKKVESLNRILDVLRRNANNKFRYVENFKENQMRFDSFFEILENTELSVEEKYEQLMAD